MTRCNVCGDDDPCLSGNYLTCSGEKYRKEFELKANAKAGEAARLRAMSIDDPDIPMSEVVRRGEQRAIDEWNAEHEVPARPWHEYLPDNATLIRALVERGTLHPSGIEREVIGTDRAPDCSIMMGSYHPIATLFTVRARRTYWVDSLEIMATDGFGATESYADGSRVAL